MTVYVEVVILNNLLIDLLLGITTSVARRRKIHKWRQVFAAVAGAGAAAAYVVLPPVAQIVIRAVLAPVMALIFDKYTGFKDYLVSLAIFALLTFALGGTVTGIGNLLDVDPTRYLTLGLVALGLVIMELTVKAMVIKRAKTARTIKSVSLGYKGKTFNMQALYDSGNSLTDVVTALPIVLLSANAEKELSGLDAVNIGDYEGYVTVESVGGEGVLPIIELDGIIVDGKALTAYAALSGRSFDGFDVILNNTMFGREYENKRNNKKNIELFGVRRV